MAQTKSMWSGSGPSPRNMDHNTDQHCALQYLYVMKWALSTFLVQVAFMLQPTERSP